MLKKSSKDSVWDVVMALGVVFVTALIGITLRAGVIWLLVDNVFSPWYEITLDFGWAFSVAVLLSLLSDMFGKGKSE